MYFCGDIDNFFFFFFFCNLREDIDTIGSFGRHWQYDDNLKDYVYFSNFIKNVKASRELIFCKEILF
jgi:hypothetical protein